MSSSSWKGWAELENDPAIFSTLLREWGVPSIQVNEVVPLDSIFSVPADSVFGLIFLARWTAAESPNDTTTPPSSVWFANQTSSYSCATVAIMNIINNYMGLDLGTQLNRFRFDTLNMTPKARGEALDQFDHVRDVHNSFATEIEKMDVDMRLKVDALEAEKKKKRAELDRTRKGRKRRKINVDEEDETNSFHFIAYVPAAGSVWRMDGMEALPRLIDTIEEGDDWLMKILTDLQGQWESAESNQLEFSLLSLTTKTEETAVGEDETMMRTREDWGPFMAQFVKLHAEKGDLTSKLA